MVKSDYVIDDIDHHPDIIKIHAEAKRLYDYIQEHPHVWELPNGGDEQRRYVRLETLAEHGFDYILEFKEKYNLTYHRLAFFMAKNDWQRHIDSHAGRTIRAGNLLLPIQGCDESTDTVFTKMKSGDIFWNDNYWDFTEDATFGEPFVNRLTRPTLVNTTIPHRVIKNSDATRIICVMGIGSTEEITWDEISNMFSR